jgi:hypothetical protein
MNTSYLENDVDWLIYADYLDDQNVNHLIREDMQCEEENLWCYEYRVGSGVDVGGVDVGVGGVDVGGGGVGGGGVGGGGVGGGGVGGGGVGGGGGGFAGVGGVGGGRY